MKIKSDFVTNSSSTCYVLSFTQKEHEEFQKLIDMFSRGVFHITKEANYHSIKEYIKNFYTDTTDLEEELQYEIEDGKTIIIFEVSDELGYGFAENTKFNNNIIWRSDG